MVHEDQLQPIPCSLFSFNLREDRTLSGNCIPEGKVLEQLASQVCGSLCIPWRIILVPIWEII